MARSRPGAEESLTELRHIMEVNFVGSCITVQAALPAMRRRRRGQIALISSLAALRGLPYSPAYCASKAALIAYGEALRAQVRADGIEVSLVLPGFVDTPMAARVTGPKPLMVKSDRAAGIIRAGLARGRTRITFPFLLGVGMRVMSMLPTGPVDFVLRRITVSVAPSK